MTIQNFDRYKALSQIFNKTWGAPSHRSSSTESQIFRILDDQSLKAMFLIVVNFSSEKGWQDLRKKHTEEGIKKIAKTLKNTEEEYKKLTGESVSFKIQQNTIADHLEFVSYSSYNPKKTAYFRLFCQVEIT